MAVITEDLMGGIKSIVGDDGCDSSLLTRRAYRYTHGAAACMEPDFDFLPGLVVWPESVEQVRQILMQANEAKVPIVVRGGGSSTTGAEGLGGCIVMDLCRMDKILDFNPDDARMTGEAGVRMWDWLNYAAKRGYTTPDVPAPLKIATLGSRLSSSGFSKWETRWGSVAWNVKAAEVVLVNGDVVHLARGSSVPSSKSSVGYNLMDLFGASRGTLGVVTKLTQRIVKTPPALEYGIAAFRTVREGLEAYIDLKQAMSLVPMWRQKFYYKYVLKKILPQTQGEMEWPDDIDVVVDYHILGMPEVVEASKKFCRETVSAHGGFWRENLPPTDFLGNVHATLERYIGMGSVDTDRVVNGGMGNRLLFLDPGIPNSTLIDFTEDMLELFEKMEDGKSYPSLAKNLNLVKTGSGIALDEGYTKDWMILNSDVRAWDRGTREEFLQWYREFTELVWKHKGTVSCSHHWIPREIEAEILKRELGETEYELGRRIKDFFDPNHILNPPSFGYYRE